MDQAPSEKRLDMYTHTMILGAQSSLAVDALLGVSQYPKCRKFVEMGYPNAPFNFVLDSTLQDSQYQLCQMHIVLALKICIIKLYTI